MQFFDVSNDIAFRKIFGNEKRKESFISFLNAVLSFDGEDKITSITYLDPVQLPYLHGLRVNTVDVKATNQAQRSYLIEMQMGELEGFGKRVLYYASKSYSSQIT